ncbi:energy transducer TonB [Alcanivorax sp. JB21]|uniref:energy transducer TonB n=1 Tax=Alcanivorax limicola TaxID=2874102 RepID=UPI001CBC5971|nr:energy transducer TonB [Alcanivorax limicola]MBZ2190126.1 energy transducer TonB [Alcanivorax limicola]
MKLLPLALLALLTLVVSACVTVVDEPATAPATSPATPEPTLAVPPQVRENPVNYPPQADGERGTAMVQVMVLASGRTGDSVLVQSAGSEILDRAALDSVRQWRFAPARDTEGQPMDMATVVSVVLRP